MSKIMTPEQIVTLLYETLTSTKMSEGYMRATEAADICDRFEEKLRKLFDENDLGKLFPNRNLK